LISLALLATASVAQAHDETACLGLPTCQPPAKYASGPFLQKPIIRIVSARDLQSICQYAIGAQGDTILGCAEMTGTTCLVRIAKEVRQAGLYETVVNHELAHCRGWRY
jgi:hypothetical protein